MGNTRKRRFAAILGTSLLATAGMGVAVAQGGISAHLALSNTIFNMEVGQLKAEQFSLFPAKDKLHNGDKAISRLKMAHATVSDVCMTAPINIPGMGDKKFQMLVPGDNFSSKNMVVGAQQIDGAMQLINPQIGVDANQIDGEAPAGSFGLVAEQLIADGQAIKTTSLSADEITAAGSKITIEDPDNAKC